MQQTHVPLNCARYWTAFSLASVFGAHSADFVAQYLQFGYVLAMLPFAAMLAVILIAGRRTNSVHQAYYWLAIVVIRAVTTNIADLGASDLALKKIWLITGLALILGVTLFFSSPSKFTDLGRQGTLGTQTTDTKYWTAMLVAGTLGTLVGDLLSFDWGLGTACASIIQILLAAVLFVISVTNLFANISFYWLIVVVLCGASISVTDYFSHNIFGIPLSALVTGLLLIITLFFWKEQPTSQQSPEAR
jgi:uncharacterized membrane-anchored protein